MWSSRVVARSIAKMRLQGGGVRPHEAAQEEANEPDLHRNCCLAALIALSASAATADENPYSANSMLPACMAVLAISSGNPAAGIDPLLQPTPLKMAPHRGISPRAGGVARDARPIPIRKLQAF